MLFLTSFLLISSLNQNFSDTIVHIPFTCVDNRIVLKIKTIRGKELNFTFDTGSPGILLDSTTAGDYNLTNPQTTVTPLPFATHGSISSQFFKGSHIFKDSILNALYTWGKAINFANLPKSQYLTGTQKTKISGIIGPSLEGHIMDSCILLLDFKEGTLSLIKSSIAFKPKFAPDSVKMVYSNDGFGNGKMSLAKMLPSAKIKLNLSSNKEITTNAFFDTGCQYQFLLLSSSKTDSLTSLLDESKRKTIRSAHTNTSINPVYSFNIDSLTIGGHLTKPDQPVSATMTNVVGLSPFGGSRVGVLIGVEFMKKFKQIYFDYPDKEIYFVR